MDKILLVGLVLVLLVAGCSNFDISSLWGGGGTQVKELPPDILSIQNITVIPSTSVRVEDQFSVYFDLMDQDELSESSIDYNYSIYDTGLCDYIGGDPNSSSDSSLPQEIRQFEWNFEAPTSGEIANLRVTCPIRFRFDFLYTAKSQIDVLVINSSHLRELQQRGESTTFSPTLNVGRGPIKIYFDFGTTLPVRDNTKLTVYVRVEDKGTGLLKEIDQGKFIITFPEGFTVPSNACTSYFTCTGIVCTSNQPIPIISKKTLDIRCSDITTPSVDVEKTYFIGARLENYGYYVTGEADVEVKP